MAGDTAGKGELAEKLSHPVGILRNAGVDLAVGAFQVGVGHQARATVARPGDVDDVDVAGADDAVQVRIDEVEARCGAPMS